MSDIDAHSLPGLQEAIARYGVPCERTYDYEVSHATFQYWQLVRSSRVAEVVLLLPRANGCYLVQSKEFYPAGTFRLMSGGIKPGKRLDEAVQRETIEETGLDVSIERFVAIQHHRFTWQAQVLCFTSYLFEMAERAGVLASNDPKEAISGYREVTLMELASVASQLESLPPDWIDWGRFRATAHRLAVEVLGEGRRGQ